MNTKVSSDGAVKAAQGATQSPSQPLVEVQEPATPFCFYEPVSLKHFNERGHMPVYQKQLDSGIPLYATPVRGLPLTKGTINAVFDATRYDSGYGSRVDLVRALEAELGICSPAPGGDGEAPR